MIEIYTVEQAKVGILRRDQALQMDVPTGLQASIQRVFGEALSPEQAVRRILADVRGRGDEALHDWTQTIDGVALDKLAVSEAEMDTAVARTPTDLYQALEFAASRIRTFHECQPLPNWTTDKLGGRLGQRVTPIRRVGVYVPGGTAPLPSSLLMSVIPA
jgi:histidinol dehydrogenase